MFLKRRLAACTVVIAALAVPVASASAAITPVNTLGPGYPRCPDGYTGPTNPATGCPPWMMIYSGVTTVPVASASPATTPVGDSGLGYPRCPDGYTGPTNPATGCPPWLMIYGPPPVGPQGG
jgi:hypothetical protein